MLEQSLEFQESLSTLEGCEFNCERHIGCMSICACELKLLKY